MQKHLAVLGIRITLLRGSAVPQDVNEFFGFANPTDYQGDYNRWRFMFESNLSRLQTSLPVRVDRVYANGVGPVGLVDITVLVSQVGGDGTTVPGVSVPNVPYFRLQGGANAVIIDPKPGDIGMAAFCSRDISAVKNARSSAPPGSARRYDPSDAMYFGGFMNGAPTQYIQFTEGGIIIHSPTNVTVEAPSVNVNAAASATVTAPAVSLGSSGGTLRALVDERFNQLFNNHTHGGGPKPDQTAGSGQITNATKAS